MALTSVADGLFAEKHGSAPARVVAMHGWGRRGSDFSAALDGLDALALDLPGFGASTAPTQAVGARGYAEMVRPVVEGLADPPILVGHSFGGRVAVCLAAQLPVAGLVLAGVPLLRIRSRSKPSMTYRLIRWAHSRRMVSDDRMERERRRRGSTDYRSASGVMRDVLVTVVNESYEEELAMIDCPVRLVWGADDTEVSPHVARLVAERLRERGVDTDVSILPGIGHLVPTAAPAALRAAIDALSVR
jgi:pimeloyl-ACP methyl ester carboxylesterase